MQHFLSQLRTCSTNKARFVCEPQAVHFFAARDVAHLGRVSAPKKVAASDIVVRNISAFAWAGALPSFEVALASSAGGSAELEESAGKLESLARHLHVDARLHASSDGTTSSDPGRGPLPFSVELSANSQCVVVSIPLPPGVPEGSQVSVASVEVAGESCPLPALSITVGVNHAVTAPGPVTQAAQAGGDVVTPLRLGGSTEETDYVRCFVCTTCVIVIIAGCCALDARCIVLRRSLSLVCRTGAPL
jgi:hypothetical protein